MNGGYQIVDLGRIKTEGRPISVSIERNLTIDDNKPILLIAEVESVFGIDTDYVGLNMWLSKIDVGIVKPDGSIDSVTTYFGIVMSQLGSQTIVMISKSDGDRYLISISGGDV